MTKPKEEVRTIELDPNPKGELKMLGGSRSDKWNLRLVNLVGNSLPIRSFQQRNQQRGHEGCLPGNG